MEQLSNEEDILIFRYLDDDMTGEERSAFEAELEKNKVLREAYEFELRLFRAGKSPEEKKKQEDKFRLLIEDARNNWENSNSKEKNYTEEHPEKNEAGHIRPDKVVDIKTWQRVAVAAAIMGIVVLGVVFYQGDSQGNMLTHGERQSLFAQNYQVDDVPEDESGLLQNAFQYIKQEEYPKAIEELNNVDTSQATRGGEEDKKLVVFYIHYYKGLSYIADSNMVKAFPELDSAVAKSVDDFSKAKAQWYLSLANLKAGELKKTEDLLQKIARNTKAGEYRGKAASLIKELSKP